MHAPVVDLGSRTGCVTDFGAGLETLTPQVDRFLFSGERGKRSAIESLTGHLHPIVRYYGAAALLEASLSPIQIVPKGSFRRAVALAEEASEDLLSGGSGLSYAFRAQKLVADAPIRRALNLERRLPTPDELEAQRTATIEILGETALAAQHEGRRGRNDAAKHLNGYGAELAVAVLLDDVGSNDFGVDYVTVSSLLSQDILGRRKRPDEKSLEGSFSRNWDLSVYTTDVMEPAYKLNVKHVKPHSKPCVDDITPVVLAELTEQPQIFTQVADNFGNRFTDLASSETHDEAQQSLIGKMNVAIITV